MRGLIPEILNMAGLAQRRGGIFYHQEFTVAIVMRIMAAGALHLSGFINFYRPGQGIWVDQFTTL